jgi:hypothetical protein
MAAITVVVVAVAEMVGPAMAALAAGVALESSGAQVVVILATLLNIPS